MPNKSFTATGVWLRRMADTVQLLVERDGRWYLAIEESIEGNFSHIAEGNGADRWPLDPVTERQ